jgi:hypothetical protein
MKNRFYGDVNDYIKYGILDILSKKYKSIGINWYLTDDQHGGKSDGKIDHHITKEKAWRGFNSRIYGRLKNRLRLDQRNIKYCREDNVFDFQYEFIEQLPDNASRSDYEILRNGWHARAKTHLSECDLIFFDPDIGVIEQLSKGVVKNSEYCLAKEIADYDWCDWLVVVFPKHAKRYPTLKTNPIVIRAEQQHKKVMVFIYGGMALLYISKKIEAEVLSFVFKEWDTRVETKILVP